MIVREHLYESKQVGTLYHIMDYQSLLFNLTNNKIGNGSDHKLSFTRSKNYLEIPNHISKNKILGRFTLDGNKMSEKYRIKPYKAYDNTLNPNVNEFEEQIIGIVKPLHVYLIKIEIFRETLFDMDDFQKKNKIKNVISEYSNKYDINIKYIK